MIFSPSKEAEIEQRNKEKALNNFAILKLNLEHKDEYSLIQNFLRTFEMLSDEQFQYILRKAIALNLVNFLLRTYFSQLTQNNISLIIKQIHPELYFITLPQTSNIQEPSCMATKDQLILFAKKHIVDEKKSEDFYQRIQPASNEERALAWQRHGNACISR